MKRYFAILLLLAAPVLCLAQATDTPQGPPRRGGQGGGRVFAGQGVAGTIAEIKSDGFTVKTMEGKTVTVKVTSDTRFRKDRQEAKVSDFKPGDAVLVGGEPAGADTWTAHLVASRGQMDMQAMREGMGKQFIAGAVKAIDGTKLTVARPDGQDQTIEVDENTSFRKGRESITLPDIKVGDHLFGRGQLNSAGVFVPQTLNVGGGGGMGMGMGSGGRTTTPPPQQPPK